MRGVRSSLLELCAPAAPPAPAAEGFPGLDAGKLHEAVPELGAETAVLAFLMGASAPGAGLLWVREDAAAFEQGEPYAPGLSGTGLECKSIVLVRAAKRLDALWAAEEGLKRPGLRVLLELGARGKPLDLTATRRLSLAAENTGATALVLRGDAARLAPPSAAWTRWRIAAAPSLSAHRDEIGAPALLARLTRHRGGLRPQQFILEWTGHGYRAIESADGETMGGDLAPALVDGSDRPQRDRRAVA